MSRRLVTASFTDRDSYYVGTLLGVPSKDKGNHDATVNHTNGVYGHPTCSVGRLAGSFRKPLATRSRSDGSGEWLVAKARAYVRQSIRRSTVATLEFAARTRLSVFLPSPRPGSLSECRSAECQRPARGPSPAKARCRSRSSRCPREAGRSSHYGSKEPTNRGRAVGDQSSTRRLLRRRSLSFGRQVQVVPSRPLSGVGGVAACLCSVESGV